MPRTLHYYGGKARIGLNRWIRSHLPEDDLAHQTYIEPFAGALSILISRPRAGIEIVNDKNERIARWHTCIRDHAEEMSRLIAQTHYNNHDTFEWAKRSMDDESLTCCLRSLAVYIVADLSMMHVSDPIQARGMSIKWRPLGQPLRAMYPEEVAALRERLRGVQVVSKDFSWVMERSAGESCAVLYVDPPYKHADTDPYAATHDRALLEELLLAQEGYVAISGYDDEWDHLGWQRHELEVSFQAVGRKARGTRPKRTEALWCNRGIKRDFAFF